MNNIRNFCIISHIDHGKSTLADRFLEITKTIDPKKMKEQFLDSMELEREKGITIKMQPVRMEYMLNDKFYTLNLIDTPGHVDFSYEVSRSLASVEGAVLLVDASKGIQAQTLANLEMAKKQNLIIIPAVNKIDLPQAMVKETKEDLAGILEINESDIFEISAKKGTGVKELLEEVIRIVPPPLGNSEAPLRALIFDSKFDAFKGIIAFIMVVDGSIKTGQKFYLSQQKESGLVKEIGIFKPNLVSAKELSAGDIGYLATGIKEAGKVRVGDTVTDMESFNPLPGYKEPKAVIFASIYPENPDDFDNLKDALVKLKLNDASFTFEPESKEALGRGFKCGFLGSLHTEIISERLKREFGLDLIISSPSVVFKIINQKGTEMLIYSPSEWPKEGSVKESFEPWAKLEVMVPQEYYGRVSELINNLRGKPVETKYFGSDRVLLAYEVPLKEIIAGFYDNLKGVSQGFASMNYEILEYRPANLVKLDILLAGEKQEALAKIVVKSEAQKEGKRMAEKLKDVLPDQMFSVPVQAAVNGDIIARETLKAKRRDVIAPLYGGDYSRKRKLLERQKKGKKKLKERGQVHIPPNVFLEMFKYN